MPKIQSVEGHYEQHINEYYMVTVQESCIVCHSEIFYDGAILLTNPGKQNILIPKQNAYQIIEQFRAASYCFWSPEDMSTEQIINNLEESQKREIASRAKEAQTLQTIKKEIDSMRESDPKVYAVLIQRSNSFLLYLSRMDPETRSRMFDDMRTPDEHESNNFCCTFS